MTTRRPFLLAALLALGGSALHAEATGVELLGFGESGPSQVYATERFASLRFQVTGDQMPPEGAVVVLRRDDGATTLAPVTTIGTVLTAEVPLKSGRFTLNEYRAFLLLTDDVILESPESYSLIGLGAAPAASGLAAGFERRRRSLGAAGTVPPLPPAIAGLTPHLARLPGNLDEGFDAGLVAGSAPGSSR